MVPAHLPSDSSCTGWRGCNIHGLPAALDEQRLWNKPHTCGTLAGTDLSAGVSVRMALSRLSGLYFWIQTLKFPAFVDTASPWQLLSIAAPSPGASSHSPCSSGKIHGYQVPWGGNQSCGEPPQAKLPLSSLEVVIKADIHSSTWRNGSMCQAAKPAAETRAFPGKGQREKVPSEQRVSPPSPQHPAVHRRREPWSRVGM